MKHHTTHLHNNHRTEEKFMETSENWQMHRNSFKMHLIIVDQSTTAHCYDS